MFLRINLDFIRLLLEVCISIYPYFCKVEFCLINACIMKKLLSLLLLVGLFVSFLQASVSFSSVPRNCVEKKGIFTINRNTALNFNMDNAELRNAVACKNAVGNGCRILIGSGTVVFLQYDFV